MLDTLNPVAEELLDCRLMDSAILSTYKNNKVNV